LIKSQLPWSFFMKNFAFQLSTLSHFIKGGIMKIVNGKLTYINTNSVEDDFQELYQHEELPIAEIESLQTSVENLTTRVDSLETSRLQELHEKLEAIEKRTAKQILAIALLGSFSLSGLGVWIEMNKNYVFSMKNTPNLHQENEK